MFRDHLPVLPLLSLIFSVPMQTMAFESMGIIEQQDTSGPVVKQASATGVSVPVRDLPASTKSATVTEPREINPQNTIPIKGRKKSVSPAKKKKPSQRHNLPRKPVS